MVNQEAFSRFPAERRRLIEIREFIAAQAKAVKADQVKVDDLVLAVEELAANIIMHGYQDGPGEIEITFRELPDVMQVILRDRAPLFDSTGVPQPDIDLPLNDRPVGGLGVHLVRQCVDRFEHRQREGGGNEILLEVRKKSSRTRG